MCYSLPFFSLVRWHHCHSLLRAKVTYNGLKHSCAACLPSAFVSQVDAFVREHLRPLERSGLITPEQRRWAAGKAAAKVMARHAHATSADFLLSEGASIRRLGEQYLERWRAGQERGSES